eukprot:CAMPEP_0114253886 /NCGR_PEP_ID=MMETSP0058-20121206/16663_1 /TAXON_ID=36894 /ORGANISM="Pyramimonas parkeae, CCMP726" /LENGTH=137 /DNA_ID=CAMNT_0001368025 /DNA_START=153 /DNA_END=566 /DNA_ORIENTATION=+
MDGRSVWVISLQLPVVLAHHATPAPERTTRVCDVLWVLIEAVGTRGAHGLTQFAAGVRFWSVVQVVLDLDGLPQLVNREVREAIERVTVAVLANTTRKLKVLVRLELSLRAINTHSACGKHVYRKHFLATELCFEVA